MENKEAKNNQSEQQDKRNKDSASGPWDNFEHSNIRITGVLEGKEKEQEIGTLCEKIMKGNFPNLVKEIDMQVQEAQSPKQDGCRQAHSKTHHNQDARA